MSRIDFPKIYNPANQTPQELIENFVVRTGLFQEIFEEIRQSEMKNPEQHYIIQGIRGQGKTTLLLRIAYEIDQDAELRKRFIPIVFNEEQYNISRLFKLWETIAEYLDDMGEIKGLYDEMQKFENEADFEERCFQILEKALKKNHKKMILFIDNIDELLTKFSRR
ncbi:MAG TPA: P-loop NTPase fold protein, partial [bacterium]